MYSAAGKRIINRLIAGQETTVGNYISLGINAVADASLDGSTAPYTHNVYHSPYIVDDIEVSNVGVVNGGVGDDIKFVGVADISKKYIADNIALVVKRTNTSTNEQRTIAHTVQRSGESIGWNGTVQTNTTAKFNNSAILAVQNAGYASYNGTFSAYTSSANDIIAFPLFFTTSAGVITAPPNGAVVTLTINYYSAGDATYTNTITSSGGYAYFNTRNQVSTSALGTIDKPTPFLFQRRLYNTSSGSIDGLIAGIETVSSISITLTGAGTNYLNFGPIKLSPDFTADVGRTTTAFRKLSTVLHKSDNEAYTNAEYTLLGMV